MNFDIFDEIVNYQKKNTNESQCSPKDKNRFLDLRERILTYKAKNKEKMRKLLSEIEDICSLLQFLILLHRICVNRYIFQ